MPARIGARCCAAARWPCAGVGRARRVAPRAATCSRTGCCASPPARRFAALVNARPTSIATASASSAARRIRMHRCERSTRTPWTCRATASTKTASPATCRPRRHRSRAPAATPAPWPRRPDVLLVVLESFRADLVGAAFEGKPVTPVLDALAARGYSAPAAYSHNGYTVQSRFHLFSGTLAGPPGVADAHRRLQVPRLPGGLLLRPGRVVRRLRVRHRLRSRRRRRATRAPTATSATPRRRRRAASAVPLAVVEGHVREFLGRRRRGSADLALRQLPRHALSLHPRRHRDDHVGHAARRAKTSCPASTTRLWATYANTAANVDRAIGARHRRRARGARARAGVVVTSDHGESLFDEGFLGHGYVLNEIADASAVRRRQPAAARAGAVRPERAAAGAAGGDERAEAPGRLGAPARGHAPLFQYLGDLARPQTAGVSGPRRPRALHLRLPERPGEGVRQATGFRRPSCRKLNDEEFLALVRFWERIQLARKPAWQRNGRGWLRTP